MYSKKIFRSYLDNMIQNDHCFPKTKKFEDIKMWH